MAGKWSRETGPPGEARRGKTFGRAGDLFRGQAPEPGRACWSRSGSHTGPGYQGRGAQCLGFLWGQRTHGVGVLPRQESRMAPTSLKGEPTVQERGPLGSGLVMLASQYAVFASPHFGDPWWARQDSPSSSRCPHRPGLKVLDPLTCLIPVKWSWAPESQLAACWG